MQAERPPRLAWLSYRNYGLKSEGCIRKVRAVRCGLKIWSSIIRYRDRLGNFFSPSTGGIFQAVYSIFVKYMFISFATHHSNENLKLPV